MKKIILLFLLFSSTYCISQNESKDNPEEIFTVVEEMPSFPGGPEEMYKFIQSTIKFPESAIKNKIMGKCYLNFVIKSDGSISNLRILKGTPNCPECDEEAMRLMSVMPNWIPGKQNGKNVSVIYNLPLNFKYK